MDDHRDPFQCLLLRLSFQTLEHRIRRHILTEHLIIFDTQIVWSRTSCWLMEGLVIESSWRDVAHRLRAGSLLGSVVAIGKACELLCLVTFEASRTA